MRISDWSSDVCSSDLVATSASNSAARNPLICRALMADPRILQFTGIDQDVQPVLRRGQRAGGKRVHRTRRIVGLVEIDHGVAARIGRSSVEKTPGAIGFAAIAAITENQKQAAVAFVDRFQTKRAAILLEPQRTGLGPVVEGVDDETG